MSDGHAFDAPCAAVPRTRSYVRIPFAPLAKKSLVLFEIEDTFYVDTRR